MRTLTKLLAMLIALGGTLASGQVWAGNTIHILVLREGGVGSASQAQPYVDQFVALAAKANGWAAAEGKYASRRARARRYIDKHAPEFGILSLGAFLQMRAPRRLKVVGLAEVAHAGGRRYHLVSKSASNLGGCKGHKLATNHGGDPRFIDKVVAGGSFTLADFELVTTRRPVQTIKKVIREQARCALIDDAQLAELGHIEGGRALRSVWQSPELPPMAVVAFSSASTAQRAKFKGTLGSLCEGAGKGYCSKVGIRRLAPTSASTYAGVVSAYGR